jgi:sec-independent protein translocase protein TatC
LDDTPRSLIEHLSELRTRILYSLAALAVGAGIGIYLSDDLFRFMTREVGDLFQFTPAETFLVQLRLGILMGIVLALPVILYQVAAFILPGLTAGERAILLSLLPGMVILFAAGWAFGWYVVVPITRRFLEGYAIASGVETRLTPRAYVDFVMHINNPLGIAFQLPLAVLVLARVGLVTSGFLRRVRKYAILLIFVAAAILSPPTVIDQVLLAIPMLLLYEVSIWIARVVERRRA